MIVWLSHTHWEPRLPMKSSRDHSITLSLFHIVTAHVYTCCVSRVCSLYLFRPARVATRLVGEAFALEACRKISCVGTCVRVLLSPVIAGDFKISDKNVLLELVKYYIDIDEEDVEEIEFDNFGLKTEYLYYK